MGQFRTRFDWPPTPGKLAESMEDFIIDFIPEWKFLSDTGLKPEWLCFPAQRWVSSFEDYSCDLDVLCASQAWRRRIHASAEVGAHLDSDQIGAFNLEIKRLITIQIGTNELITPNQVFSDDD